MPLGRDRVHGRPHLLGLDQESRRGEAFEIVAMSQPRIGTRIFSPAWRMYVKTDFSKTGNSPKQRGRIVHWPAIGARSFHAVFGVFHVGSGGNRFEPWPTTGGEANQCCTVSRQVMKWGVVRWWSKAGLSA